MEVIPEQWSSSLTTISRKFREVWDGTGRSSQNQIYTCMANIILKSCYIAWQGHQEKGIGKTLEKKTRELVTEKRTLCSWLELLRLRRGQSLYLIVSILLPNHLWSLSLFYNQASSFSHALQIYCLGLLGETQSYLGSNSKLVLTIYIYIFMAKMHFWFLHFGLISILVLKLISLLMSSIKKENWFYFSLCRQNL